MDYSRRNGVKISLSYLLLKIPKNLEEFIDKVGKREYRKVQIEVKNLGYPDYYSSIVLHTANLDMEIKRQPKEIGLAYFTSCRESLLEKDALQEALDIALNLKKRFNDEKSGVWINYKTVEETEARLQELEAKIEKGKKEYPSIPT